VNKIGGFEEVHTCSFHLGQHGAAQIQLKKSMQSMQQFSCELKVLGAYQKTLVTII